MKPVLRISPWWILPALFGLTVWTLALWGVYRIGHGRGVLEEQLVTVALRDTVFAIMPGDTMRYEVNDRWRLVVTREARR